MIGETLEALHVANQWVMIGSGALAFGVCLAGIRGGRRFGELERRSVGWFVSMLGFQVLLGALVFVALTADGQAVFDGDIGAQWSHPAGGVVAALLGVVAIWRHRRALDDRSSFRAAAAWTGLALFCLGDVLVATAISGVALGARLALSGNRRIPEPQGGHRGS